MQADSPGLWGWGLALRKCLCCFYDCCCDEGSRTDVLFGYRHWRIDDRLAIHEELSSPLFLSGTQLSIDDAFATRNSFHGLGLLRVERHHSWQLEYYAKCGLGWNDARIRINGTTTVQSPGVPLIVSPSGLYALSSNSGTHDDTDVTSILQLGFQLGYQVRPGLLIKAGYSIL